MNDLRRILGSNRISDKSSVFMYLNEEEDTESTSSAVTWYDARESNPDRTEFRLYFRTNPVMDRAAEGDLLLVAKDPDDKITIIVISSKSPMANQVLWLFEIPVQIESAAEVRDFATETAREIGYAERFILEELGVTTTEPDAGELDELISRFNGEFPSAKVFSQFARSTCNNLDIIADPDHTLLYWVEREELLFRRLERQQMADRLELGFWSEEGPDVDEFVSYSLSIQNRRKSRAGLALENHLEQLFISHNLNYDSQAVTENNSKPDFVFPGITEYRDDAFPADKLTILGVKSTCKDRWRQVLSEASRVPQKALLTLEPGISSRQTDEMKSNNLQLIVPAGLHETYSADQKSWLFDIRSFIFMIQERQSSVHQ